MRELYVDSWSGVVTSENRCVTRKEFLEHGREVGALIYMEVVGLMPGAFLSVGHVRYGKGFDRFGDRVLFRFGGPIIQASNSCDWYLTGKGKS